MMAKGKKWHSAAVLAALVVAGLGRPPLADADLFPVGPEIQVNAFTLGWQQAPAVAPAPGGGFTVVWEGPPQAGPFSGVTVVESEPNDSSATANPAMVGDDVSGTLSSSGDSDWVSVTASAGSLIWINLTSTPDTFFTLYDTDGVTFLDGVGIGPGGTDTGPRLFSVPATGTYFFEINNSQTATTYTLHLRTTDNVGVFGRRFDATGAPLGTDFPIGTGNDTDEGGPRICSATNGNFVVAWSEGSPVQLNADVFARRFDSVGTPLGSAFQVNSYTSGVQYATSICCGATGDFAIVWDDRSPDPPFNGLDGQYGGVFGRKYTSSGAPAGGQFQVNVATLGEQARGKAACDSSGNFVVVWDSGSPPGVKGRRFGNSGAPIGGEFTASSSASLGSIAAQPNGDFMVTIADNGYGPVLAQRYTSLGAPLGTQFQLSPGADYEHATAADPAGGFAVAWQSYGLPDILATHVSSAGVPQASALLVNDPNANSDTNPVVAAAGAGEFVVVWFAEPESGPGTDGSGSGVFARKLRELPCAPTPDTDGDLIGNACDNCPSVVNRDQRNSDCVTTGTGCSDGGDLCDVCPALADNTQCDPAGSGAVTVGAAGLNFSTSDNSVSMSIPAGAFGSDTSVSVTENGPASRFILNSTSVLSFSARPEDARFGAPITVTVRWKDRDGDGNVDTGVCNGGPDVGLTCDANGDCPASTCSRTTGPTEASLVLKRNIDQFSKDGFAAGPFRCSSHQAGGGCETAVADCNAAPGTGKASVANCCNTGANEWTFQTCSFSEYFLGDVAGDLVPGGGKASSDCIAELAVDAPTQVPYLDDDGLPNRERTCTDGDQACDKDGHPDGKCELDLSLCFNLADGRLLDDAGAPACTAGDVASWAIKSPKPDDPKAVKAANGTALRDAVLALGTGTIGGTHQETLTFTPALATPDQCTTPVRVVVPLKGADLDRKGTAIIKTRSVTGPEPGRPNGRSDKDKLKLVCLPRF